MKNEQGGLSEIIKSVDGLSVGKIVQCVRVEGTHTQHGIIWLVRSKSDLVTEYGAVGKECHVPDDWLRPIKPGVLDKGILVTKPVETI